MQYIRLADGTVSQAYVTPWSSTGDVVSKYLVVLPGLGSTFLTPEELAERLATADDYYDS